MSTVISVENLSKTYRLGQIGTPRDERAPIRCAPPAGTLQDATRGRTAGTFSRDLEVWWAKVRGKPNASTPSVSASLRTP